MHTHRNIHRTFLCIPCAYTGYILCSYSAYNHTAGVSVCISLGVPVNVLNEALKRASTLGHTNTIVTLLAAGADVNCDNNYSIRYACELGHYETVLALLEAGADVPVSVFQASIIRGHTSTVSAFISKGGDIHGGNEIALIIAVSLGHTDIIDILLAAGADVDVAIEMCESPVCRGMNNFWTQVPNLRKLLQ